MAAFVHGVGLFLVTTEDGLFSIDLESNQVAKVCEGREIYNVVPYVSCHFYEIVKRNLFLMSEIIKIISVSNILVTCLLYGLQIRTSQYQNLRQERYKARKPYYIGSST